MIKKVIAVIILSAIIAAPLAVSGCGLRERIFMERRHPNDSQDATAADSDGDSELNELRDQPDDPNQAEADSGGKLVLDELEQEIDELLNLLNQLDTVEESDLEL